MIKHGDRKMSNINLKNKEKAIVAKDELKNLKLEMEALIKKRKSLCQKRDKLNDLIVPISEQIDLMRNKIGEIEIDNENFTIEDLFYNDSIGSRSKKHRKKLEEYLNEFKYFKSSGYYYDEIKQTGISICLDKKANLEVALNGVIKIREHLKTFPDEDFVRFDIFEHTLSENGSYDLVVHKTEDRAFIEWHYGTELEETTIVNALRYIKNNLWYE